MKRYKALVGLTYPASKADVELRVAGKDCKWKTVEAGDFADDIPPQSVDWLLEDGRIEAVGKEANDVDVWAR